MTMTAAHLIGSTRKTPEPAASATTSRTNAILFKEHLDEVKANTNRAVNAAAVSQEIKKATSHSLDVNAGNAAAKGNAAKKSAASKSAQRGHSHPPDQSASVEQSGDPASQAAAAASIDAALPLIGVAVPLAPGSAAETTNIDAPSGSTAANKDTTSALSTVSPNNSDSVPLLESQDVASQNIGADPKAGIASSGDGLNPAKNFTFVRVVPAGQPKAGVSTGTDNPGGISQSSKGASDQSIKVIVQQRGGAAVSSPASCSTALPAQEALASQEVTPQGDASESSGANTSSSEADQAQTNALQADTPPLAPNANQSLPPEPAASQTATNMSTPSAQAAFAIAGLSGSGDTGHKHKSDGSGDSDNLLQSNFAKVESVPSAASTQQDSASFASLVANSAATAPVSAKPGAITSEAAAQVPPPPVEQIVFGLSCLNAGTNSFSMQLAPERLGSVSVQLEVDAKGKTRAAFRADRPETLALMRQDSHQLIKALQEAGVKADAGSLTFSLKDQGGPSHQERRAPSGNAPSPKPAMNAVMSNASSAADTPSATISSRLYDLQA